MAQRVEVVLEDDIDGGGADAGFRRSRMLGQYRVIPGVYVSNSERRDMGARPSAG